ncbi:hypothetical protein KIN20_013383 [Parelaphostrongylus tenuis]|uniref:Uncharacterized protein n=1 Tax=Parelaphostrongylus tenuis TaxID=148309 RepID=A0AAD5N201_PARTN|nr:hypothetical protein KIN20_013383 [Parelaphostrongylus tenuis]
MESRQAKHQASMWDEPHSSRHVSGRNCLATHGQKHGEVHAAGERSLIDIDFDLYVQIAPDVNNVNECKAMSPEFLVDEEEHDLTIRYVVREQRKRRSLSLDMNFANEC